MPLLERQFNKFSTPMILKWRFCSALDFITQIRDGHYILHPLACIADNMPFYKMKYGKLIPRSLRYKQCCETALVRSPKITVNGLDSSLLPQKLHTIRDKVLVV